MASLVESIRAALGEGKVDLLIKNGRVVNVFSGQIERKDVAIFGGMIVGFGDYRAKKVIDVKGDFLCPGLIDGHVHIESSMVTLPQFARAVLPGGTTSVVIDPHEIANVMGLKGIRFMAQLARAIPLNVFIMAPSCYRGRGIRLLLWDFVYQHLLRSTAEIKKGGEIDRISAVSTLSISTSADIGTKT
jgi:adenine deaminase